MKMHLMENRLPHGWASFGGYWPRGSVRDERFAFTNEAGNPVRMQSEIAARWPDGSVKWSRHLALADEIGRGGDLTAGEAPAKGLSVRETKDGYTVQGEQICLSVPKEGQNLAAHCRGNGADAFDRVFPVLRLSHVQETDDGCEIRVRSLPAVVKKRSLESSGPLEAVFRFEGAHLEDGKEKMPFLIRMYVRFDGEIAFDDTFFFAGDADSDRLAGWGLRFETRLTGRSYQRHIRFLTDGVPYHDQPTQLFHWKKRLDRAYLAAQQRGETVETDANLDEAAQDLPRWDRFCLTQDDSDHFCIRKKAWERGCWLEGVHGRRAPGVLAVSDPERTLSFAMRECWEKHPAGLEAEGLSSDWTACTVWFYAPGAEPFDFRHYDRRTYPMGNYEGFDYMLADPNGIAVTCHAAVRSQEGYVQDEGLRAFSESVRRPPVYLAAPEYYHEHRAFGYWSLRREGTEVERWIEDQLDKAFSFYENEAEARRWYGLFNYGDLMHTYEACRHMWRYDVGGYAWDNTELAPTYWLWYQFLRTGSERVFRMAEALSRHASDVDMYHFGPMKGLGSRHNVRHWGCPCKEPRVSMAGHHRPLYYLTGDRRVGDCMEDSLAAAESLRVMPWFQGENGVQLRIGPDWAALLSNWMTAYERTLDQEALAKMKKGIADLSGMPIGLTSGPIVGFDPATGALEYRGEIKDNSGMHLSACMGETEVYLETAEMLDCGSLSRMTAENGLYFFLSPEERLQRSKGLLQNRQFGSPIYSAEMQAWAARTEKDGAMAHTVWVSLLALLYAPGQPEGFAPVVYGKRDDGTALYEIPWITTNFTAQWCLKAIVTADLLPCSKPETLAELDRELLAHPSPHRLYGA